MFYLGEKYQFRLEEESQKTYKMIPVLIFTSLFPIIIGLLLRLPKLIMEIQDKKEWTFDWIRVVAIGIPALYITTLPILAYTSFGRHLLLANELITLGNTTLITTAGIVFGYVLLDSVKK